MALVAIFVVIATVFRSYVQPVIIKATIPFGVIGAVLGHYVMGIDLAMFGVFAMVRILETHC